MYLHVTKVKKDLSQLEACNWVFRDIDSKTRTIFEENIINCNCGDKPGMASVHQGAFSAKKMREREEKIKASLNPMQYNTKFMDSIWGQYNRYSVHNLKKIMNERTSEYLVSPAEKLVLKKNEVFSAELGASGPFVATPMFH